ncbi:MAG: 30S ribosomal protein S17 [Candidatus Woesearchaeota archaeon]
MAKKPTLKLRGREFVGTVTSDKMRNTVTVSWTRRRYLPKYERYERKMSKIKAHNPESIDAKEGDMVRVMECRPLSKTKNFVVVEIIKEDSDKKSE